MQPQPSNNKQEPLKVVGNRRRHKRLVMDKPVRIFEVDKYFIPGEGFDCEGFDLSQSGMGLRCRKMMHVGTQAVIRVPLPDNECRYLFGIVRNSRYHSNSKYHIGIEFKEMPANQDLQRWLAAQKAA